MLKKFEEIGLSFIKPQNKEGNDAIKTALYEANDIVYHYKGMYASPLAVQRVLAKITKIGKDLSQFVPQGKAIAKYNEVINALRQMVVGLRAYLKEHPALEPDDWNCVSKTMNYWLQLYIKAKQTINTGEEALRWLGEWQEIAEDYLKPYNDRFNLKNFYDAGPELLSIVKKIYSPFKQESYEHFSSGATVCDYATYWLREKL